MALHCSLPTQTPDGMTLHLTLSNNLPKEQDMYTHTNYMPAEWAPQSGVQLTWPHSGTDWAYMLEWVTECYLRMAYEIASREPLVVVAQDVAQVRELLQSKLPQKVLLNIRFAECPTNDTWARDHGALTVVRGGQPVLLDFVFNGWGGKFESGLDNLIPRNMQAAQCFNCDMLDGGMVLEGGSIETDGNGTLLTTAACLLNTNRNPNMSQADIEHHLRDTLHIERFLWLHYGHLDGDDTDSHVDTLARLCPGGRIAYVQCTDMADSHYADLHAMEEELQTFDMELVPLPMPRAIYDEDGERLPATYANYLVMDTAVLMPTYDQPDNDNLAAHQLQKCFPTREIVKIDCRALIQQHGSLHCCTMQFPRGVLNQRLITNM